MQAMHVDKEGKDSTVAEKVKEMPDEGKDGNPE